MRGVNKLGGTLVHDGAKNKKRNALNCALQTVKGTFFIQSTDCTGEYKNQDYIYADVKAAINKIGMEKVFIVCMDGACKAVLKLLENDASMHKIFPQRCCTHALDLLAADVSKRFEYEITLCIRLVRFICQHEPLYGIFSSLDAPMLMGVVDTRFVSNVYCVERIKRDKGALEHFFSLPDVKIVFRRDQRTKKLLVEFELLSVNFVYNADFWKRLDVYLGVMGPIKKVLRLSDGHEPNLATIAPLYEDMRAKILEAVLDAETLFAENHPLCKLYNEGMYDVIQRQIDVREADVVSKLSRAAAMVHPDHLNYEVKDGDHYINSVIDRYYSNDVEKKVRARLVYRNYRNGLGSFFGDTEVVDAARKQGINNFWIIAESYEGSIGPELFGKLLNGYAGQGESERLNKDVKNIRTTERNMQSHEVTTAYLTIKNNYRLTQHK